MKKVNLEGIEAINRKLNKIDEKTVNLRGRIIEADDGRVYKIIDPYAFNHEKRFVDVTDDYYE